MQVREIRQQPIYIPFKKDKSLMSQQTPVNSTAQGSINNRINFKGDRYTLNLQFCYVVLMILYCINLKMV